MSSCVRFHCLDHLLLDLDCLGRIASFRAAIPTMTVAPAGMSPGSTTTGVGIGVASGEPSPTGSAELLGSLFLQMCLGRRLPEARLPGAAAVLGAECRAWPRRTARRVLSLRRTAGRHITATVAKRSNRLACYDLPLGSRPLSLGCSLAGAGHPVWLSVGHALLRARRPFRRNSACGHRVRKSD